MNKKDLDRKNSYHKHKNHANGCQFFYDSGSIRKNSAAQDPFSRDDFDLLEEKEYRRRFKRMRYNDRRSGFDA